MQIPLDAELVKYWVIVAVVCMCAGVAMGYFLTFLQIRRRRKIVMCREQANARYRYRGA